MEYDSALDVCAYSALLKVDDQVRFCSSSREGGCADTADLPGIEALAVSWVVLSINACLVTYLQKGSSTELRLSVCYYSSQ